MGLKLEAQSPSIHVQGLHLEWAQVFQYLEVWINQKLTDQREIHSLVNRTKAEIPVIRTLTVRSIRGGHKVLGSFHIHGAHSLLIHAFVTLITSTLTDRLMFI